MTPLNVTAALGVAVLAIPAAAFVLLALLSVLPGTRSEGVVSGIATGALSLSWVASLGTLVTAWGPVTHGGLSIPLGSWFSVPGYSLQSVLLLDVTGAVFMTLTTSLLILVSVYSGRYLHREPGFARFFLLMLLFAIGMLAIAAGGSLDIVFGGWELVGLSSALLIAFFHRREAPVRHGLRAFAVYRTCDVGFLAGVVLFHELTHSSVFREAFPALATQTSVTALNGVALLFVLAAMGKSAMLPFTGWLPRAMEGPTPSSAIFYGALSIHAGPFLLLRLAPLLDTAPIARAVVLVVGVLTALHATTVGRVQTDIKSKLAYASVAQVSLIWVEVGLGLHTLALVHMAGHATLRTWELLRAPSFLRDWRARETLRGPRRRSAKPRRAAWLRDAVYRLTMERWYLDELGGYALGRVAGWLHALDGFDRAIAAQLERAPASAPSDPSVLDSDAEVQRGVS
jgi:NADH:ubiquinone oxidoreductase subunit 5 (subunit L)/multisubunit Na+/H+ antiporter MnhA subunit